jgi:hypothetical protein
MKKYLIGLTQKAGKLIASIALATSLIRAPEAKSEDGMPPQLNNYNGGWNQNNTLYLGNQGMEPTNTFMSRATLNANNLVQGLTNLKFYAAGLINTNQELYEYDGENFIKTENVKLNPHNTTWHIDSIRNLGKWPDIFGLEKRTIFIEDMTNGNYNYYLDTHKRVFNRDIYEVNLATANNTPYTTFQLDLDLITPEPNATNDNNTAILGVIYAQSGGTYYGYFNKLMGTLNQAPNASRDDWNTNNLPNAWEATYFDNPTNTQTAVNANQDPDLDGAKNLEEYLAGTNPTNNSSCLKITNMTKTNQQTRVNWQGANANFFYEPIKYSISKSTNLLNQTAWKTVATNLNQFSFTDNQSTDNSASYRIGLEIKQDLPPTPGL